MTVVSEKINKLHELTLASMEIALQKMAWMLEETVDKKSLPEWVTFEEAVSRKGGAKLVTVRQKPDLQPNVGVAEAKVGGRRVWHRDTVLQWILITDAEIPEYKKRCHAKIGHETGRMA